MSCGNDYHSFSCSLGRLDWMCGLGLAEWAMVMRVDRTVKRSEMVTTKEQHRRCCTVPRELQWCERLPSRIWAGPPPKPSRIGLVTMLSLISALTLDERY